MHPIHFGTSGWRDIIADGFTFENVRAVTRAVAAHLRKLGIAGQGVVVGRDFRFLSERFVELACEVLSQEGVPVHRVRDGVPTPVIAATIQDLKLAGGVNFTASHNPGEYQGFKWSNQHGSPATKEEVAPIEAEANRILATGEAWTPAGPAAPIVDLDPKPAYLKRLAKIVPLRVIRAAKLKVVADPLFGVGRGYLDEALRRAGCRVTVLHDALDPLFGGLPPEPNAERLAEASRLMQRQRGHLVLGTDGDADRFGVVDRDGTFLTPNQVLTLTVYLLVKHRDWKGRVVRSVVTSHQVDAVAQHFGLEVEVTPVGFKYIGESMIRGGFLAGGEESGGLTIAQHVPEKDGILACLLMAELVARERKSLGAILKALAKQTGTYLTDRVNLQLASTAEGDRLREKLASFKPTTLAGCKVSRIDTTDGFKFLLDNGSWLAFRLSGTEPVARMYLEARSVQALRQLSAEGKRILGQG